MIQWDSDITTVLNYSYIDTYINTLLKLCGLCLFLGMRSGFSNYYHFECVCVEPQKPFVIIERRSEAISVRTVNLPMIASSSGWDCVVCNLKKNLQVNRPEDVKWSLQLCWHLLEVALKKPEKETVNKHSLFLSR